MINTLKDELTKKLESRGHNNLLEFVSSETDYADEDYVLDVIDVADSYIDELENELQGAKSLLAKLGFKQNG